jgi:hypothetical protein
MVKKSNKTFSGYSCIQFKSTDIPETVSISIIWVLIGHKPIGFVGGVHRSLCFTLLQTGHLYSPFEQISYGLLYWYEHHLPINHMNVNFNCGVGFT